jgi:hypothetical protein
LSASISVVASQPITAVANRLRGNRREELVRRCVVRGIAFVDAHERCGAQAPGSSPSRSPRRAFFRGASPGASGAIVAVVK